MTNEQTSLEKYTTHTLFSKGLRMGWCCLCVTGESKTEQTAKYWRKVPLTIAVPLPHSAELFNRGPEGPSPLSGAGSHYGILSPTVTITRTATATRTKLCLHQTPTNWLIKPSVTPGYIIVWRLPDSCGRKHLHRIQPLPRVKVIFRYLRPDAPVSWLTARSRVNMLHLH